MLSNHNSGQRPQEGPQGHEPGSDASEAQQSKKTPLAASTRAAEALDRKRARDRAHMRRRYHTDPEYRAAKLAANRNRYHSDPEYRAATLAANAKRRRDRYHSDPEYKANLTDAHRKSRRERYRSDPEYRAAKIAAEVNRQRKRYHSDPEYRQRALARANARHAIRSGKLARQPCEQCGTEPAQAHHDDYSQPLNVRWLCRHHHREHHRLERLRQARPEPRASQTAAPSADASRAAGGGRLTVPPTLTEANRSRSTPMQS